VPGLLAQRNELSARWPDPRQMTSLSTVSYRGANPSLHSYCDQVVYVGSPCHRGAEWATGSQTQRAVALRGDTSGPTPHRGMRHHRISVVSRPTNADLTAEARAAIAEAWDALGRAQRALDSLDLGPAPLSTPEPPAQHRPRHGTFVAEHRCRSGAL
jgi:hypothetical protein